MSLEEKISLLVDAVNRNNELLEQNLAAREVLAKAADKIKGVKSATASEEETPKAKKTKEAPKKAAEPAAKKTTKPTLKSKVSTGELLTAFGDWFNSAEGKEARVEMKKFASAVLDELGVSTLAEIESADAPKALFWLEQKKAGQKVDFNADLDEADEDDEDEDDDILGKKAKAKAKAKKVVDEDDDDEDEDEE